MTITKFKRPRDFVVVSGYYGFNNLGDEAVLEALLKELKDLVPEEAIIVLSNNPAQTAERCNIRALNRWNPFALLSVLHQARLFISGGGSLFQDASSLRSLAYYALQFVLAKLCRCPVLVYAQGLGPFKHPLSARIARYAFSHATSISLRDEHSMSLCRGWGLEAIRTADPAWCLSFAPLPANIETQLQKLCSQSGSFLIGAALRASPMLSTERFEKMLEAMVESLPAGAVVVPLGLQPHTDAVALQSLLRICRAHEIATAELDLSSCHHAGQWLAVLKKLKFVVGMRLHALILALKCGLPVIGIACDPKITALLNEFEQPVLDIGPTADYAYWSKSFKMAFQREAALRGAAAGHAAEATRLASKNLGVLARALQHQ